MVVVRMAVYELDCGLLSIKWWTPLNWGKSGDNQKKFFFCELNLTFFDGPKSQSPLGQAGMSKTAVANRIYCCICKKTSSAKFCLIRRAVDGSFICQLKKYEVERVDEKAFAKSPYICQACYARVGSPLLNMKCDVCNKKNLTVPKYTVAKKNGVLYIGSHVSVIFQGDVQSGHACSTCYAKNRAAVLVRQQEANPEQANIKCDVCGRQNLTFPRYDVTNRGGVTHIGPHVSVIFQGRVESGHACNTCYRKNRAAVSARGEDFGDAIRQAKKRRRQQDYDDEPETESSSASNSSDEEDDDDIRSSSTVHCRPSKRLAPSQLIPSTSSADERVQSPRESTLEVAKVIETLFSIERAKTETLSIREKIVAFLSLRESMREAMNVVEQSAFNVEEFVALQEYFMAMLDNQLRTIEDDQRHYTAQLTTIGK
jgi:hypothetical protein